MMQASRKPAFVNLFIFYIGVFFLVFFRTTASCYYDGYYNHVANWPDEHDTIYSEDVQGLAHSNDAWFITKSGDEEGAVLYKINVSEDLSNPQINSSVTPTSSGLADYGYTEFKAMDSWKNPINDIWYIFIGVQGGSLAGIAVYDENLNFIDVDSLSQQSAAGWCAIDNEGKLYSAVNNTSHLYRYVFDWNALTLGIFNLQSDGQIQLRDTDNSPLVMDHYQGGDFTPEGDKLYIVTGYFDVDKNLHGIHVFDVSASPNVYTRVRKSNQTGLFRYNWITICDFPDYECEEPEGLTFWDLNDGRAPNIDGELHVLLLDNDKSDDVFIMHYTKSIYVDGAYTGSPSGDRSSPDKTVTDAVNRAFDDMEIRIKGGTYSETLTISKRLRLVNDSGSSNVIIGKSP